MSVSNIKNVCSCCMVQRSRVEITAGVIYDPYKSFISHLIPLYPSAHLKKEKKEGKKERKGEREVSLQIAKCDLAKVAKFCKENLESSTLTLSQSVCTCVSQ